MWLLSFLSDSLSLLVFSRLSFPPRFYQTKEAIFGSCVGFLIHHFVVIASYFCSSFFPMCHKEIRFSFVDKIHFEFFLGNIHKCIRRWDKHFNFFFAKKIKWLNHFYCFSNELLFFGTFQRNISTSDQSFFMTFKQQKNYLKTVFVWIEWVRSFFVRFHLHDGFNSEYVNSFFSHKKKTFTFYCNFCEFWSWFFCSLWQL